MRRLLRLLAQFTGLFGFWILVSGRFDVVGLVLGAATALTFTLLTNRSLHDALIPSGHEHASSMRILKFVRYFAWVIWQMVVSSTQIAYLICHPRMPVDPSLVHLRTELRSPLARVTLANSITMVPGTLTVALHDDDLTVHALVPSFASQLVDGRMQNRVAAIYREPPQPPPFLRNVSDTQP